MNVTTAKAKIREITNTTVNDYSDASLVRDLNSEIAVEQTRINHAREPFGFDDPSYTDLQIATVTLEAGVTKYKITEDENANEVLAVHKVAVLSDGKYVDVPRETIAEGNQDVLTSTSSATVPSSYYQIGATIVFTESPLSGGTFKIWFDRAVSQITTSDTTKELPLPTIYHNLVCYRTAFNYAVDKGLKNTNNILARVQMEEKITETFEENYRADEQTVMTVESISGI